MNAGLTPPAWFNLKNYAGTTKLTSEGWAAQIYTRVQLRNLLQLMQHEQGFQEIRQQFDVALAKLTSNPLCDIGFSYKMPSSSSVYPLYLETADALVKRCGDYGVEQSKSSLDAFTACDKAIADAAGEENELRFHAHLTIDLRAKKAIIEKHFMEWLSAQKFETAGNALQHKSLTKWSHLRVLPYFDLKVSYDANANQLPARKIQAGWLFPDLHVHSAVEQLSQIEKTVEGIFNMQIVRELSFSYS